MEWKQAVLTVLQGASEPMHYTDIAEEVARRGLREPGELGATPANTIATTIGNSFRQEGDNSPFVRVSPGYYALRSAPIATPTPEESEESSASTRFGIINALGMFWLRSNVMWKKAEPVLLGKQQQDSNPVDFSKQIGVYFLHDNQGVVYVGRAIDQPIGKRLQQHTVDRLNGRWDRFSWFGIYPVESNGNLRTSVDLSQIGIDTVVSTLEAVLIEGLEPRQNRRRGDDFNAIEFLQVEDPAIEQGRRQALLAGLAAQLGVTI
ncbi:HTH domain-containing protein [Bradyrhizobium centrosematis]|uniref:HTH domain-containing protein n=1 Tax=Bradyrhizobium centrosematis TaxID=1300039 RepID=UPI00388D658A